MIEDYNTANCGSPGHSKNFNALLAVVELHKPVKRPKWLPIKFWGWSCEECHKEYPCKTFQTINREVQ
jgi:hypothetical protein